MNIYLILFIFSHFIAKQQRLPFTIHKTNLVEKINHLQ